MRAYQLIAYKSNGERFELWFRGCTPFDQIDDYCEELLIKHEYASVELHRLVVNYNIPGCLPKYVTNISRLDLYEINSHKLIRTMCNIF